MKIIMTGGSGFIGRRLSEKLVKNRHEVVVISRDAAKAKKNGIPTVDYLPWDRVDQWREAMDGSDAIVNLAGESVSQRWTAESREKILASRIGTLKSIENVMTGMRRRPRALISASAIGFYGSRGDEELTEKSSAGQGFLAETCVKWENAVADFEPYGLRTAWIRVGVVLGSEGGALARMLPIYKLGGGGPLGDGNQWMSWIHISDLVDIFILALEDRHIEGPVNGTAPGPVRNRDFSSALGRAVFRPTLFSTPAFGLKLAFGEMASILLDSQRVLPARAQSLGFVFRFPELALALKDIVD